MNENKKSTCIVISGGSVKGFSMMGALQYIEELYDLSTINTFFGTSIGSIISYLICLGYKPLEIIQKIEESNILEVLKQDIDLKNLIEINGVLNFESILGELELLTLLKHNQLFTFETLYKTLKKEIGIITYNFTLEKMELLHHTTTPDLPCLLGIQMSCCIPFIFNQVKYNNNIYLDGGFVDNFPLKTAYKMKKKSNIIGIVCNLSDRDATTKLNIIDLLTISITTMTDKTIKKYRKKCKIINIFSKTHFLNFHLTTSDIMNMFSDGYRSCKEFFSKT